MAGSLALGAAIQNTDITALSFVLLTYVLAFRFVRGKTPSVALAIILCITVYHLAAYVNSNIFDLPGTRPDSETFHEYALAKAQKGNIRISVEYKLYTNLLGALYYFFGTSYYLASVFSVLALTVGLSVLMAILQEMGVHRHQGLVILLCGLLPSTIIIGSSPMREAFQLLVLQIMVLMVLLMAKHGSIRYFIFALAGASVFGLLHKGMLFAALIITFLLWLFWVGKNVKLKNYKQVWVGGLVFGGIVVSGLWIIFGTQPGIDLVMGLVRKDPMWTIWHYRYAIDNLGQPNTAYDIVFEYGTIWEGIWSLFKVYVYYLFYPIYFQGAFSPKETYAVLESWLRLGLFGVILYHIRWITPRLEERDYLLLVLYLLMTMVWSLGTTNYGQAIRHHILSNWLLIVLAASCFTMPGSKVNTNNT